MPTTRKSGPEAKDEDEEPLSALNNSGGGANNPANSGSGSGANNSAGGGGGGGNGPPQPPGGPGPQVGAQAGNAAPSNKSLFFKECGIKTLEIKEDYETWVSDVNEYFAVSGYPQLGRALKNGSPISDILDALPGEQAQETIRRNKQVQLQGRYVLYKSIGASVKREITKNTKQKTDTLLELWTAIRNCFYLEDEATIQQLRDDIANWDMEKAGSWSEWVMGLVKLYSEWTLWRRIAPSTPATNCTSCEQPWPNWMVNKKDLFEAKSK